MVGAVILFSIGFFFLGIFGAVALMERRMAKKTMTKILEECEELYKKDYPETHNWNPAIKYETACDIIMKLCNPHDRPVMDTGNGEQATAQIIGWLLDEIKKDKVKWYKNYTVL
jgi:hypothetical protein